LTGHSTATGGKEKYKPAYLEHFEKKEQEEKARISNKAQPVQAGPQPAQQQPAQAQPAAQPPPKQVTPPHHFQRSFIDGDFEFVSLNTIFCFSSFVFLSKNRTFGLLI
jgi:hypothetical protein